MSEIKQDEKLPFSLNQSTIEPFLDWYFQLKKPLTTLTPPQQLIPILIPYFT